MTCDGFRNRRFSKYDIHTNINTHIHNIYAQKKKAQKINEKKAREKKRKTKLKTAQKSVKHSEL